MGIFKRKEQKTELDIEKDQAQKSLDSLIMYNKDLDIAKTEFEVKVSSVQIRINTMEFEIKSYHDDAKKFVEKQDEKSARNVLYRIKTLKEQLKDLQDMKAEYLENIEKIDQSIEETQRQRFDIENVLENIKFTQLKQKDAVIGGNNTIKNLLTRNKEDLRSVKDLTETLKTRVQARQEAQKIMDDIHNGEDNIFSEFETSSNVSSDPEIESMLLELKNKK